MESLIRFESQGQIVQDLHESTNRIRQVLGELHLPSSGNAAKVVNAEQMSELLSGLMRAGQWLRALPSDRDQNLEREVCAYRDEVERLRSFLPAIQAALLAERGRLEKERERLNAAASWAQASRQTVSK